MIAPIFRSLALCAACALAGPALAQAQDKPPAEDPQIVVTGKDAKTTEEAIRDFVGALGRTAVGGQLSRFEESICPVAIGLIPEQRTRVVDRMRTVAQAVNLRVDSGECVANVVVVVTRDKRAFLEALAKHRRDYFGDMPPWRIHDLAQQPGPAVAWQLPGAPLDARGTQMAQDTGSGFYTNRTTEPASRLTPPARPQFAVAVVVIEEKALVGLTATQLADYAAMRTYAKTDPALLTGGQAPTILKILDAPMGSEVPASLTSWDLGYLRGLYSVGNQYAGAQRSAIRKQVAREIEEKPDSAPRP